MSAAREPWPIDRTMEEEYLRLHRLGDKKRGSCDEYGHQIWHPNNIPRTPDDKLRPIPYRGRFPIVPTYCPQ